MGIAEAGLCGLMMRARRKKASTARQPPLTDSLLYRSTVAKKAVSQTRLGLFFFSSRYYT